MGKGGCIANTPCMKPRLFVLVLSLMLVIAPAFGQKPVSRGANPNGDYNFNETTGLINIPTARVLPAGGIFLGFSAADMGRLPKNNTDQLDEDAFIYSDDSLHLRGSFLPGWELSAMTLHHGFDRRNIVFGTKIVLARESRDWPALAVGVQNALGHDDNRTDQFNPEPSQFGRPAYFAVATKNLPWGRWGGLDLHLGWGTGRFEKRVFYGAEYGLARNFSVAGEFDGVLPSFGIRFRPSSRLRFTLMVQDSHLGLQLGYQFGPNSLYGGAPSTVEPGVPTVREARDKKPEPAAVAPPPGDRAAQPSVTPVVQPAVTPATPATPAAPAPR